MKEYSELIAAIAALLWPLFAFTALFVFKKRIGELMGRLRRGKLLGQEIELGESLEKLEMSANAVAKEVAALPTVPTATQSDEPSDHDEIKEILHEAARSPKTALILLRSAIEREARLLLASVGHLRGRHYVSLSQ